MKEYKRTINLYLCFTLVCFISLIDLKVKKKYLKSTELFPLQNYIPEVKTFVNTIATMVTEEGVYWDDWRKRYNFSDLRDFLENFLKVLRLYSFVWFVLHIIVAF